MTRILEIRGDETNVVRNSAERLHILVTPNKTGWVLSGRRGAAARLVRREPAASIRFDLAHKFV